MKSFIQVLSIAFFSCFFSNQILATCEWIGGDDVWDDPANWSCGHVPMPGDDVLIHGGVIALDVTTTIKKLTMTGGTLTAGGEVLSITDDFDWKGGTVSGKVKMVSGSKLTMDTPGTKELTGELEIRGGADAIFAAGLFEIDGGLLEIFDMGIFEIAFDGTIADGGFGGGIENAGTFYKSGGLGEATIHIEFINKLSGLLALDSGGIDFHKKVTNFGYIDLAYFYKPIIIHDDFDFNDGVIADIGSLEVKGKIDWKKGSILNTAILVCDIGGTMTIGGTAVKTIHGKLEIYGTASWEAKGIDLGDGGSILIGTGGVLDMKDDLDILKENILGGFVTVEGTFSKSMSGSFKLFYSEVPITNKGTITVLDTFDIDGFLKNEGTLTIPSGSIFRSLGGADFDSGTSFSGTGKLRLYSAPATYKFNTALTSDFDVEIGAGTTEINETLTCTNEVDIYGGAEVNGMAGAEIKMTSGSLLNFWSGELNADVSICGSCKMDIVSTAHKELWSTVNSMGSTWLYDGVDMEINSPGIFNNSGTFVFKSTSNINTAGVGGSFNNLAGGTVDFEGASSTSRVSCGFSNSGKITGVGTFNPAGFFSNDATGIVSPGTSPGILTIDKDFTNGKKLDIEILDASGAGTGHDLLIVNGIATLEDSLVVTELAVAPNSTYTILSCTGGPGCISGTFDEVVLPANYTIIYHDTFVEVSKSAALPVELLEFQALTRAENVLLEWSTATEIDNDYFLIERSWDGNDFEEIGIVDGMGNSTSLQTYDFLDKNIPENRFWNTIYYRLKQIDFDGKFDYSKTVAIQLDALEKPWSVQVHTSTSDDQLKMFFQSQENTTIHLQIVNIDGKLLLENDLKLATGSSTIQTDIPHLPQGIYLARFVKNENQEVRQFFIGK